MFSILSVEWIYLLTSLIDLLLDSISFVKAGESNAGASNPVRSRRWLAKRKELLCFTIIRSRNLLHSKKKQVFSNKYCQLISSIHGSCTYILRISQWLTSYALINSSWTNKIQQIKTEAMLSVSGEQFEHDAAGETIDDCRSTSLLQFSTTITLLRAWHLGSRGAQTLRGTTRSRNWDNSWHLHLRPTSQLTRTCTPRIL